MDALINLEPPLEALPFFLSIVLFGFLGAHSIRQPSIPGARRFALVMLLVSIQCLCYGMTLSSPDVDAKMFWIKMKYFGSAPSSVLWLSFTLEMTGHSRWIKTWSYRLLWVWPLALLVIVFSNPMHLGFWRSFWLEPGELDISVTHGPLFRIFADISLLLTAISFLLLVVHSFQSAPFFKRRNLWLIGATLAPYLGYATHLGYLGGRPIPGVDAVVLSLVPTAILLAIGVFRYKAMDIVPLAQRLVFENAGSPIIVVDHQRKVVARNAAAYDRWPLSMQDDARLDDVVAELRNRVLFDGDEFEIELDGEQDAYFLVRITAIGDAREGTLGYAMMFFDITERMAAERARQAAIDARAQFLANVSHELRTPLHGTTGLIQILLTTDLTEEQQGYLHRAEASSRLLLSLIDDVLDHARIESGQLTIEQVSFNLQSVIEQLRSIQSVLAAERGIALTINAPALERWLVGDPLRLTQVLNNLTANAIKFTERGNVTVDVRLAQQTNEKTSICFSVTDTGIGIAKDRIESLFDAFSQADASTMRRYGGNGLGLTIAQALVRGMGGTIEVESTIDVGSTFRFELEFQWGNETTVSHQAEAQTPELTGVRVLAVDDTPVNLEVVEQLLSRAGATVTTASGGSAAIREAREDQYDIVLLDLYMPEIDGFAVAYALRATARYAEVPIIAMSASVFGEERSQAFAAGVTDFVKKPFTPPELLDVVQRGLTPAGSKATGAVTPTSQPDPMAVIEGLGGNTAKYRQLIAKFVADAKSRLDEMNGDANELTIRSAAHKISGAAALLGETSIADLAAAIELSVINGEPEATRALIERIGAILNRKQVAGETKKRHG